MIYWIGWLQIIKNQVKNPHQQYFPKTINQTVENFVSDYQSIYSRNSPILIHQKILANQNQSFFYSQEQLPVIYSRLSQCGFSADIFSTYPSHFPNIQLIQLSSLINGKWQKFIITFSICKSTNQLNLSNFKTSFLQRSARKQYFLSFIFMSYRNFTDSPTNIEEQIQKIQYFGNHFNMQAQYKKFPYKVVKLQELGRKAQSTTIPFDLPHLVQQLDKPTREERFGLKKKINLSLEEKLLCYKDTAADEMRVPNRDQHHNFFNAFFEPYNNHGDVFLVPDDIWLMISLFLSKYIDKNAEKLRTEFVKHEGQKQLTIYQYASSVEQSLKMEKEWDFFFKEIIKKIEENTVPGTVEALSCNFTTTDQVYKLISTSIIMSSFKKYFSYGRVICMCGLNNIYFAGVRDDWVKLQSKLKFLAKYDVDGELKKYVESVGVILSKFLDTFDEKPDLGWWNTVMTSEVRRIGSGGDTQTSIEGWILHFYGIYQKVGVDRLPKTLISVPIKLVNEWTKTEKKLELIADWVSVSKVNEYTYKPDIGMCIVERQRIVKE